MLTESASEIRVFAAISGCRREGARGGLDRTVDVGRVAARDLGDRLALRRVLDGQNPTRHAADPGAVDQHPGAA